jgi:hypothetical protein
VKGACRISPRIENNRRRAAPPRMPGLLAADRPGLARPPRTVVTQVGRVEELPLRLADDAVDDAGTKLAAVLQRVGDAPQKLARRVTGIGLAAAITALSSESDRRMGGMAAFPLRGGKFRAIVDTLDGTPCAALPRYSHLLAGAVLLAEKRSPRPPVL